MMTDQAEAISMFRRSYSEDGTIVAFKEDVIWVGMYLGASGAIPLRVVECTCPSPECAGWRADRAHGVGGLPLGPASRN